MNCETNELVLITEVTDDGPPIKLEQLIKLKKLLLENQDFPLETDLNMSTAKILAAAQNGSVSINND